MSVSPISVSESPRPDAIDLLWEASRTIALGRTRTGLLDGIDVTDLPEGESEVAAAVLTYLRSASLLLQGDLAAAAEGAEQTIEQWQALLSAEASSKPAMTPRSNAFHMRLAKKHTEFYQGIERKSQTQWLVAAHLKTRFLKAFVSHEGGAGRQALADLVEIAGEWRRSIAVRIPGLKDVETEGAAWAALLSDAAASRELLNSASSLSGRSAPYPEDGPEIWKTPRRAEDVFRFGCAATTVGWLNGFPRT